MDFAAEIAKAAAAKPMPFTNVPLPVEGLVAHIDGDYAAYYCAGNDETEAGIARRSLLHRIDKLKMATGATSVVVHLTDPRSTKGARFHIATVQPYQGQRNAGRKPQNWYYLREYMEGHDGSKFTPKMWTTREADDGVAYVAHTLIKHHGDKMPLPVVHYADKDFRIFAGRHILWKTFEVVDVPIGTYCIIGPDKEVYGHKFFWMQTIMGDSADHIPGIKGLGKVEAANVLAGTTSNEQAAPRVLGTYREHYSEDEWADRFVEQAALLWMRVDRQADLGNFLSLGVFGPSIEAAVERLRSRVGEARKFIEGLNA